MALMAMKRVLDRRIGSAISKTVLVPPTRNNRDGSYSTGDERLCWESSSEAVLSRNLETALRSRQVGDAWESFTDLKRLYGFPEDSLVVHRLIAELSYSSEPLWLRKACGLVSLISEEKPGLLRSETLAKLCLSLARSQLAKPATEVLRLMLERDLLPPMNVLRLVVLHLVKTETGTCLASNFLAQLCEAFLGTTARDGRRRAEPMRPDATLFGLVLDACAGFELGFKGERIVELMARAGVVADARSVVFIARIHEMNGRRDELKKYKARVDRVSARFVCLYSRFYDSLLSLHFKFGDVDSATELVWEICRRGESLPKARNGKISQESFVMPIGSHNLKDGLKLQVQPEVVQKDAVLKTESKQELVVFKNGKLVLTNRAMAKLVRGLERAGNVGELSGLLLGVQKESCSLRGLTLCSDVIEACIRLGWLELAHDIVDDMEASGSPVGSTTYMLLLTMYFKAKMLREAKALVNQMGKHGTEVNLPDKLVITKYLSGIDCIAMSTRKSDLVSAFMQELGDAEAVPSIVYELNSAIHFFCKAKMIGDAVRTYRRMQDMKVKPTVQTFTNLVSGFSSLEMYREITILWGDMKRNMEHGNRVVNRDLCEYLVMSFLRGGYFERVMEVIDYMNKHGMFIDKPVFKNEFLKLHKDLYRKLKASDARTEAQRDRLRYVLAFRKWAGIDLSFRGSCAKHD